MNTLIEMITPKSTVDLYVRWTAVAFLGLLVFYVWGYSDLKKTIREWRIEGRAQNLFVSYVDALFKTLNGIKLSSPEKKLMDRIETAAFIPNLISFPDFKKRVGQLPENRKELASGWASLACEGKSITWRTNPQLKAGLLAVAERQLYGRC